MSEWQILPTRKTKVRLSACPPGLFLFKGTLGFKTEYGASTPRDMGGGKFEYVLLHRSDAYCVSSGEVFWGGAKTSEEIDNLLVLPVCAVPAAQ